MAGMIGEARVSRAAWPKTGIAFAKGSGTRDPDRPAGQRPKQFAVTNQEQSEVHRYWARDQIHEDVVGLVCLNADRQLIGEVSVPRLLAAAERQPRELAGLEASIEPTPEVAPLVELGPQPGERPVRQDGVQHHQSFDHSSQRHRLAVAVVGLANGGVERFVVHVEYPPAMESANHGRAGVATLDQARQEVVRVLPMGNAGEGALLAFDEDAAVDQDLDQEPRLSLREAERADGFRAFCGQAIDVPVLSRGRQFGHRNSSAARGSNAGPRPFLPVLWIENPDRDAAAP